jgi:hypothetical protein
VSGHRVTHTWPLCHCQNGPFSRCHRHSREEAATALTVAVLSWRDDQTMQNPIGTVQSIEHTLRNLDKLAVDQQNRVARVEKELADYRMQADRRFEHEERLKQLLARQAELNSFLDLDKGDQQGAGPVPDEPDLERPSSASESRDAVAEMARMNMRQSGALLAIIRKRRNLDASPGGDVDARSVYGAAGRRMG